jgi:flagellin-like hook-associated protein FlgL
MALIINQNLMATSAARNLNNAFSSLATPTRRLTSGLRKAATAESGVHGSEATQASAGLAGQSGGAILSTTDAAVDAAGKAPSGESAATLLNGVA